MISNIQNAHWNGSYFCICYNLSLLKMTPPRKNMAATVEWSHKSCFIKSVNNEWLRVWKDFRHIFGNDRVKIKHPNETKKDESCFLELNIKFEYCSAVKKTKTVETSLSDCLKFRNDSLNVGSQILLAKFIFPILKEFHFFLQWWILFHLRQISINTKLVKAQDQLMK